MKAFSEGRTRRAETTALAKKDMKPSTPACRSLNESLCIFSSMTLDMSASTKVDQLVAAVAERGQAVRRCVVEVWSSGFAFTASDARFDRCRQHASRWCFAWQGDHIRLGDLAVRSGAFDRVEGHAAIGGDLSCQRCRLDRSGRGCFGGDFDPGGRRRQGGVAAGVAGVASAATAGRRVGIDAADHGDQVGAGGVPMDGTPAAGAGSSCVTLSDSISTSGWSRSTHSPSDESHSPRQTSVMDSRGSGWRCPWAWCGSDRRRSVGLQSVLVLGVDADGLDQQLVLLRGVHLGRGDRGRVVFGRPMYCSVRPKQQVNCSLM